MASPISAVRPTTPAGRCHPGGPSLPPAPNGDADGWASRPLVIALWIVGSCWVLAIVAWALGGSSEWTLPLVALGAFTGLAELILRQQSK